MSLVWMLSVSLSLAPLSLSLWECRMEISTALHSPACIINGWTFLLSVCVCVCVVQMTGLASWGKEIRTALLISLPPAAMNGKSSALYFYVCVFPHVFWPIEYVCTQRTFSPDMSLDHECFLFIICRSCLYSVCVCVHVRAHRYSTSCAGFTHCSMLTNQQLFLPVSRQSVKQTRHHLKLITGINFVVLDRIKAYL